MFLQQLSFMHAASWAELPGCSCATPADLGQVLLPLWCCRWARSQRELLLVLQVTRRWAVQSTACTCTAGLHPGLLCCTWCCRIYLAPKLAHPGGGTIHSMGELPWSQGYIFLTLPHRDTEYSERQQLQKAHWSACRGCCLLCTAAMYFLPVTLAACMPFPLLCSLELHPQDSVGTWAGASGPAAWHSPSRQLTFACTIFLSLCSHGQARSLLGGLRNHLWLSRPNQTLPPNVSQNPKLQSQNWPMGL